MFKFKTQTCSNIFQCSKIFNLDSFRGTRKHKRGGFVTCPEDDKLK